MPVIISARAVEDPEGRRYSIVTFTDISDVKRVEQELRTANRELEERYQEIQEDLTLAARVQQSLAPKSIVWGGVNVETFYQSGAHDRWRFWFGQRAGRRPLEFAGVRRFRARHRIRASRESHLHRNDDAASFWCGPGRDAAPL